MTELIYHITSLTSWSAAQKSGAYTADLQAVEGFIHCSKVDQVLPVANAFYRWKTGLVLLEIDLAHLGLEVRWESGADKPDELFPHVYGPINLTAVIRVLDFQPGQGGTFTLPPL